MDKPVKEYPTEKMYDYHEVIKYLEDKYKFQSRDYYHTSDSFEAWVKSKESKDDTSYSEYKKDVDAGKWIEPEYADFWHWFIKDHNVTNGSMIVIHEDDLNLEDEKQFIRIIIDYFKAEGFFDEDGVFTCWVSW